MNNNITGNEDMKQKAIQSFDGANEDTITLLHEALENPGNVLFRLDEIKYQIPYVEDVNGGRYRPCLHIGQRKLFIKELQFLNKLPKNKKIIVIYAGGSPGHHMHELSRYFKHIKFIIIDPSKFKPYVSTELQVYIENGKFTSNKYKRKLDAPEDIIYIYNLSKLRNFINKKANIFVLSRLCTSDLLIEIKKMLPGYLFYLWSDIRTDNAESGKFGFNQNLTREQLLNNPQETKVTDGDILWNLTLQYNWIKTIKPELSLVKFRAPFYTDNIDNVKYFMNNNFGCYDFKCSPELNILDMYVNKKFIYPKGEIYIQSWTRKSTTESRLLIKKEDINNLIEYDSYEYDAKFNYYNLIERNLRKHNIDQDLYQYEYCECNDCAIEISVLREYIENNREHILKEFDLLDIYTTNQLIGNLSLRLSIILGTNLNTNITDHGINRY